MQKRILIFTLLLLAISMSLPAQEVPPVPEDAEATEEQDSQEPGTELPTAADESPAQPAQPAPANEPGEPGLESFTPSEEISADRSVAFPNDI